MKVPSTHIELTEAELAWIAGFFDGEGYVGLARNRSYFSLHAQITQNDPGSLEWIAETFGGLVRKQRAGAYKWGVTAGNAAVFLDAIRPFLRLKCEQVDIALSFQARRGTSGVRRELLAVEQDLADAVAVARLKGHVL